MKGISIIQPWATAIVYGVKSIETRSWTTNYRGRIAIHAAKTFPKTAREFASVEFTLGRIPKRLPFGAIIGYATLYDIKPAWEVRDLISSIERMYGDYTPGRFAWMLKDIERTPDEDIIPYAGKLGLFDVKLVSMSTPSYEPVQDDLFADGRST